MKEREREREIFHQKRNIRERESFSCTFGKIFLKRLTAFQNPLLRLILTASFTFFLFFVMMKIVTRLCGIVNGNQFSQIWTEPCEIREKRAGRCKFRTFLNWSSLKKDFPRKQSQKVFFFFLNFSTRSCSTLLLFSLFFFLNVQIAFFFCYFYNSLC